MIELLIIGGLLGALFFLSRSYGRWKQRAKNAEAQNKMIRKAHEIQNGVAFDPDERERVRRHFDSA